MVFITTDYQIATGNNNVGGLALFTSLTDANGVNFVEPTSITNSLRGTKRISANGVVTRVGFNSVDWVVGLLVTQWEYLKDNLEGLVTVRTLLNSGSTFANYNAVLTLQDPQEMRRVIYGGAGTSSGFEGAGFEFALLRFTRLEVIP